MASVYLRSGVWYARWRDGLGRPRRKATSAKSRREALGLLAELSGQAQRVRLGLEAAPVETRLTLAQLFEWWVSERCPEASQEMARLQVGKHVLKTELAAYPLPMVTADELEAKVFLPMEKAKAAPATLNKVRGYLSSAFEAARQPPKKWSGGNPAADVRVRQVPKKQKVTLSPEQVEAVLPVISESWRGVMAVAAYLGLRRGEIFALKKTDYDREHQTLRVAASHQRETTKGGRHDTLPVPSILRPYLEKARRTPGFWLFPDELGNQRTRESDPHLVLRRACGRIGLAQSWLTYCLTCKRAGRPHERIHADRPEPARCTVDGHMRRLRVHQPLRINFHGLRHSCATNLMRAGVPLAHVSRILRHSSIRITADIYGHLEVEDLRGAVEAVGESHSSQRVLTARTQTGHSKEVQD